MADAVADADHELEELANAENVLLAEVMDTVESEMLTGPVNAVFPARLSRLPTMVKFGAKVMEPVT